VTDKFSLPEAVRARLNIDGPVRGLSVVTRSGVLAEARIRELRMDGEADGHLWVEGYASVTEEPYDVAGGPPWGWTEVIARGAFAKALEERDDVRFLENHEGRPLARTKSGTMTLSEDSVGLLVRAGLDLRSTQVQEIRYAMERGDMDEMSFAFRATRQEWNEDYTERRITEARLFDVSIVTYPANPATHIQINSGEPVNEPAAVGLPLGLAIATIDALKRRRVA